VRRRFFWLCFEFYFWFRLVFGVCLVEVVDVEAFFQHGVADFRLLVGILNIVVLCDILEIKNPKDILSLLLFLSCICLTTKEG
jgi:hypothetical protein